MKNREQIAAVVTRLRSHHAADRQEQLGDALRRWIEDPVKPRTDTGSLRLRPILVLLAVMALLAAGTFVFFSFFSYDVRQ